MIARETAPQAQDPIKEAFSLYHSFACPIIGTLPSAHAVIAVPLVRFMNAITRAPSQLSGRSVALVPHPSKERA